MKVFIGLDSRENDAYRVCQASLERHSSIQLDIEPLMLESLTIQGHYTRTYTTVNGRMVDDIDGRPFSTEFAFTRFLVPNLKNHRGWALFCDCDFLWRRNVADLFAAREPQYAVMCVKHDYRPEETVKMDGQAQQRYFRKNWSSLMLWNCGHPSNRALTEEQVNTRPGSWLHGLQWLKETEIGPLPENWNWLVGHSSVDIEPWAVHFTSGGPWFNEYRDVAYADEWFAELESLDA